MTASLPLQTILIVLPSATALCLVPFLGSRSGAVRWLGLEVRRHEAADADHAVVEFVARYKIAGRAYRLHEVSRFVREEGRWYYLDGDAG